MSEKTSSFTDALAGIESPAAYLRTLLPSLRQDLKGLDPESAHSVAEFCVRLAILDLNDMYPAHPATDWITEMLSDRGDRPAPRPKDADAGGANNITTAVAEFVRFRKDMSQGILDSRRLEVIVVGSIVGMSSTSWARLCPESWARFRSDSRVHGKPPSERVTLADGMRLPAVNAATGLVCRAVAAQLDCLLSSSSRPQRSPER